LESQLEESLDSTIRSYTRSCAQQTSLKLPHVFNQKDRVEDMVTFPGQHDCQTWPLSTCFLSS